MKLKKNINYTIRYRSGLSTGNNICRLQDYIPRDQDMCYPDHTVQGFFPSWIHILRASVSHSVFCQLYSAFFFTTPIVNNSRPRRNTIRVARLSGLGENNDRWHEFYQSWIRIHPTSVSHSVFCQLQSAF
jgi:hypothetical protein